MLQIGIDICACHFGGDGQEYGCPLVELATAGNVCLRRDAPGFTRL
jgi:hypothetical protein